MADVPTNVTKAIVLAGVSILAALFAWLVWPTPYRYDHVDYGRGTSYLVKQNRLTGRTQVLFPGGWRTVSEEDLGSGDVTKLDVHGHLFGGNSRTWWDEVKLDIYNGSPFTLKEMTIEVSVLDSKKQTLLDRRVYRSVGGSSSEIRPFQTGSYAFPLGVQVMSDYVWTFRVVGAKGTRD